MWCFPQWHAVDLKALQGGMQGFQAPIWTLGSDCVNPFKSKFTTVIFIHYKARIVTAILVL